MEEGDFEDEDDEEDDDINDDDDEEESDEDVSFSYGLPQPRTNDHAG